MTCRYPRPLANALQAPCSAKETRLGLSEGQDSGQRTKRAGIAPETAALLPCGQLCGAIARMDAGVALTNVLFEHPSKSALDLLEVDVDAVEHNDRKCQVA